MELRYLSGMRVARRDAATSMKRCREGRGRASGAASAGKDAVGYVGTLRESRRKQAPRDQESAPKCPRGATSNAAPRHRDTWAWNRRVTRWPAAPRRNHETRFPGPLRTSNARDPRG